MDFGTILEITLFFVVDSGGAGGAVEEAALEAGRRPFFATTTTRYLAVASYRLPGSIRAAPRRTLTISP
jgi:hypothetical protein